MRIDYRGHACVKLTSRTGEELLLDPFEPEGFDGRMRYGPIEDRPDYVATTHDHADHAAVGSVPGCPEILPSDPEVNAGAFRIRRVEFDHDEYDGRRFGGSVDVLVIEVDEKTVVHGADIGQSPPPSIDPILRHPDIFLVPVGGLYTIGAGQAVEWCVRLAPGCVVPIHYKTDRCDLPIDGPETFLQFVASNQSGSADGDADVATIRAEGFGFDVAPLTPSVHRSESLR